MVALIEDILVGFSRANRRALKEKEPIVEALKAVAVTDGVGYVSTTKTAKTYGHF